MRMLLCVSLVLTFLADVSLATPQVPDRVVFGGRKYWISEVPMLGLWDDEERSGFDVGDGRVKPPPFDVRSSANWDGYEALFEIRDSQFFLRRLTGHIDGKKRKNEQILEGREFPLLATWFTGRIHLGVGDHDQESDEMTAVIIFEIDKGVVTSMSFKERMRPVYTWNGLPEDEVAVDGDPEAEGDAEPDAKPLDQQQQ